VRRLRRVVAAVPGGMEPRRSVWKVEEMVPRV
jgi:hypothetical protein